MNQVQTGLERLKQSPLKNLRGKRIGILCNPASVDGRLRHARHIIDGLFPGQVKALFSPQHGFFAEKQDNMVESDHMVDPVLKVPVFSLYGETRRPTKEMFDPIDVLLVDLQDVGTRVYTFIYTLSYCMEAARDFGCKIIILDRPNPIGGIEVEGNCLEKEWCSFVGRYPLPMRHGLTIGELARLFNDVYEIGCDLELVAMRGWHRDMFFADTGLPWIAPSPNLPTPTAAIVYPGQVIWEGTNVSEGRGTTQPFEFCGAPFIDPERLFSKIGTIDGGLLRPIFFEPTANKWAGQVCGGVQIHVTDASAFRPYATSLGLLQAIWDLYHGQFEWKKPPYEYEFERMPIDLIMGSQKIRKALEEMTPVANIEATWQADLADFRTTRENYLLYS